MILDVTPLVTKIELAKNALEQAQIDLQSRNMIASFQALQEASLEVAEGMKKFADAYRQTAENIAEDRLIGYRFINLGSYFGREYSVRSAVNMSGNEASIIRLRIQERMRQICAPLWNVRDTALGEFTPVTAEAHPELWRIMLNAFLELKENAGKGISDFEHLGLELGAVREIP